MSGGVWERVATYIQSIFGSSGFTNENITSFNSKYFDIYDSNSNSNTWNKRILGDATGEMGPFNSSYVSGWYSDNAAFTSISYPCFQRGGKVDGGIYSGLFYFNYSSGGTSANAGFRLVLAPYQNKEN